MFPSAPTCGDTMTQPGGHHHERGATAQEGCNNTRTTTNLTHDALRRVLRADASPVLRPTLHVRERPLHAASYGPRGVRQSHAHERRADGPCNSVASKRNARYAELSRPCLTVKICRRAPPSFLLKHPCIDLRLKDSVAQCAQCSQSPQASHQLPDNALARTRRAGTSRPPPKEVL